MALSEHLHADWPRSSDDSRPMLTITTTLELISSSDMHTIPSCTHRIVIESMSDKAMSPSRGSPCTNVLTVKGTCAVDGGALGRRLWRQERVPWRRPVQCEDLRALPSLDLLYETPEAHLPALPTSKTQRCIFLPTRTSRPALRALERLLATCLGVPGPTTRRR